MGCRAVGVKGQNQGTSCFYLQIRYGTTSNVIVMILTRQRTTVGWEKRVEWDFLGHSNISWKLGPVKINSRKLWRKRNTKIHSSLFSIGLNIYENSFSQNRKKIRAKPWNYPFPLPETVSLHCFTFFWLMLLQSFIFEIRWSRKSEVGRSSSAFVRSSLHLRRFVFRKV